MANHRVPVPGWLNESYMTKVLEKGLKTPNIKVLLVDVKPGSAVGDNFCCQIFRIKVEAEISKKPETIFVIGKVTPESKFLDGMMDKIDVFDIEARFFETLLPKFAKFTDMNKIAPKIYHVDFENKSIFMEDLKESDYELQPRGKFLNLDQILLTVEALATFHGSSWNVLRDEPEVKDGFMATVWDGEVNEMSHKFMENTTENLKKYLDSYELSEKCNKSLSTFSDMFLEDGVKIFKRKDTNLNVLLHGDSWMNNMLYHYNKDGIPDSVKLLDFQIIYYGNYVHDLQYFLFSSANTDVLISNLDIILETYYLKLKETAPEIPNLTLERVREDFEKMYIMGYCMLISFRSFITAETPPNFEEIMEGGKDEMGFNHPNFIKDVKTVMPFLEEKGVLDKRFC